MWAEMGKTSGSALWMHAALLALFAMVLPLLLHMGRVNGWSLGYARTLSAQDSARLPPPPDGHPSSARWLAQMALQQNRPERALALLADSSGPFDPFVLHTLGRAYAAQGKIEEAAAAWTTAGDYTSLLALAAALEADGRLREAETIYWLLQQVDLGPGTLALAAFLVSAGRRQQALALLRSAVEGLPHHAYFGRWQRRLQKLESEQAQHSTQ